MKTSNTPTIDKWLATLLACLLAVSLLVMPAPAFADEADACEVVSSSNEVALPLGGYATWEDFITAVTAAGSAGITATVRLNDDLATGVRIVLNRGQDLTIDLNGHTLDVSNAAMNNISLYESGGSGSVTLTVKGPGTLDVHSTDTAVGISTGCSLYVTDGAVLNVSSSASTCIVANGSKVIADRASSGTINSIGGYGVQASNGAEVVVNSVSDAMVGVMVGSDASITVTGIVQATLVGLIVSGGGSIIALSDVEVIDVEGYGAYGCDADGGSISIHGDLKVTDTAGGGALGVEAAGGTVVDIAGSVTCLAEVGADPFFALTVLDGSSVSVGGNVSSTDSGISAEGTASKVDITGSLSSGSPAIDVLDGAEVSIGGDVTSTDAGVVANEGAQVVIYGNLAAPGAYIVVDSAVKVFSDGVPDGLKGGLLRYDGSSSVVWAGFGDDPGGGGDPDPGDGSGGDPGNQGGGPSAPGGSNGSGGSSGGRPQTPNTGDTSWMAWALSFSSLLTGIAMLLVRRRVYAS